MNISKLIIGSIVGGVILFLMGWLIYGNLLADFMAKNPGAAGNVDRKEDEMEYLFLGLGCFFQGVLLTFILLKSNVNSIVAGLTTGGLVGFLYSASINCMMYGTTTIVSKKMMAADVIVFTVMMAITGAIVALIIRNRATNA